MKSHFKLALLVLGLGVAGYLIWRFILPLFAPFILAAIIALLIEPLVGWLQKKTRISRGIAVALSMALLMGALGLLLTLLIIRLVSELIDLSNTLPQISHEVGVLLTAQLEKAQNFYWSLPPQALSFIQKANEALQNNISSILGNLQEFTISLVNSFSRFLAGVPGGIIFIIVTMIAVFFFSRDRGILSQGWMKLVPSPWDEKLLNIGNEIWRAVLRFVKAQLILVSITMIMSLVGLTIIGSKYALIMGLTIGFFDLLPILGPSSIYIPWIIWELIRGHTGFALALAVLYIIVLVSRQVLETKVVADTLGLHPLSTLISMYVGLQVMGIAGIIAGPLSLIAAKAVVKSGVITFRVKP